MRCIGAEEPVVSGFQLAKLVAVARGDLARRHGLTHARIGKTVELGEDGIDRTEARRVTSPALCLWPQGAKWTMR